MNSLNFNIDNGYLEGLVRGFKAGILKQSDYANLVQCETLEGKCSSSDLLCLAGVRQHRLITSHDYITSHHMEKTGAY